MEFFFNQFCKTFFSKNQNFVHNIIVSHQRRQREELQNNKLNEIRISQPNFLFFVHTLFFNAKPRISFFSNCMYLRFPFLEMQMYLCILILSKKENLLSSFTFHFFPSRSKKNQNFYHLYKIGENQVVGLALTRDLRRDDCIEEFIKRI